ncbi:MAG: glutamate racemase [Tannerella sp.]|jgi:glutamate racemase|nr:glutamate racemase [Tannerella sp.]
MNKSIPIPVGIFDSGYGGLTILEKIREWLPQYDYLYLGDNARTPYGTRSFEVVYQFTRQCVQYLFNAGCPLVILACNTASAKALRTIQQRDLPRIDPARRVLGIIRPTVEAVDRLSRTKHIGIFGTPGTIVSQSYKMEIEKLFPDVTLVSEACPMWVPLVENNEYNSPGADYFVKQHVDRLLARDSQIDTILLGCTHYPLLTDKIKQFLPRGITVFPQGEQVADRLKDYLQRHSEIEELLTQGRRCRFLTTESVSKFSEMASLFLKQPVEAVKRVVIG